MEKLTKRVDALEQAIAGVYGETESINFPSIEKRVAALELHWHKPIATVSRDEYVKLKKVVRKMLIAEPEKEQNYQDFVSSLVQELDDKQEEDKHVAPEQ